MDHVTIRRMRSDDLPRIMEIETASYGAPWAESSFRALLRRADAALFVADSRGTVAGYAVCWAIADQGELGNIAVAPEWRRRGLARRLLTTVIETMRARGVRELYLEVRPSNDVARHLYETFGFVEVGWRPDYYTAPVEDAVVMRKLLEPTDD